ncbi:hypothetical protein ABZX90_11915 [Streptomyces sp. NPDC002935]
MSDLPAEPDPLGRQAPYRDEWSMRDAEPSETESASGVVRRVIARSR